MCSLGRVAEFEVFDFEALELDVRADLLDLRADLLRGTAIARGVAGYIDCVEAVLSVRNVWVA